LRFRLTVAALLVAWSGSMLVAQKVTTPEDLDKAMKNVQKAMQATQAGMKSGAYDDARKQLVVIKQMMDDSREFWVLHKKDDAIKANQEVVAKLDAAEKVLSATPVDASAAAAALKEVGGACLTCHKAYRVRDAENNWVLKPGAIGG
jgi:cytochrome c556